MAQLVIQSPVPTMRVGTGPSTGDPLVRPAPPATGFAAFWRRAIALSIGAMYFLFIMAGWVAMAPAGHEGIIAVQPSQDIPGGLALTEIVPGSAIHRAGIKAGDVIIGINGVPYTDKDAFHQVLHERRAGDVATVRVRRLEQKAGVVSYGTPQEVAVVLQSQLALRQVVIEYLVASVVALLVVAVAVVVACARPGDLAARLLLIFGGSFAFMVAMNTLHWALPSAALGNAADFSSFFMMVLGSAALLHLFLAFPVPHPFLLRLESIGPDPLRRVGGAVVLLYALPLAVPVALYTGVTNEYRLIFYDFLALLIGALLALIRSYWLATSPLTRAQLKWITPAFLVFVASFVLGTFLPGAVNLRVQVLPPAFFTAIFAFLPVAIAIAILRYRLWDVDILIRRTLIYSVLTVVLGAVYVGAILVLQELLRPWTQGSQIAVAASTLAVAALFGPVRARVQEIVDRRFYRRSYVAAQTLEAFSARIRDDVDLTSVADDLVQVVQQTIQPAHVSLWLRPRETSNHLRAKANSGVAR